MILGVEQEIVSESSNSRLAIKLDLNVESHEDFMKTVEQQMADLKEHNILDNAEMATSISSKIGMVLQAIVPIIDDFATVSLHVLQD